MSDIVSRLLVDGAPKLALRIPSGALKGAGAALAAAMAEEGRLVAREGPRGTTSLPWRFESILQDGEGALLVGPDPLPGAPSLDEAPPSLEGGLSRLLAAARALASLHAEGALPRGIASAGVLLADDGRALVLPPGSVAKALAAGGAEARLAASARLSSPRAVGPESDASFLLAQAAYRFATGRGAFEREAAAPGGMAGSGAGRVPTGMAAPRLDPGLAAFVDAALENPAAARLSDWITSLSAAQAAGWTRELSPGDEAAILRRREELESRRRASEGRAAFFRKRGALILAAAGALVAIALVGGDMLRAQRDRPDFSWLTPRELVQRYYLALDGLDMESLEACGDKRAIKSDVNVVMNITVITKTRTAYEGKSPIARAVDWIAAGKPALAQTDFLYGITGLSISGGESFAGASALALRAEYSIWSLERKEDPAGDPAKAGSAISEERRRDELRLERGKKGGWTIVGLDRATLP